MIMRMIVLVVCVIMRAMSVRCMIVPIRGYARSAGLTRPIFGNRIQERAAPSPTTAARQAIAIRL